MKKYAYVYLITDLNPNTVARYYIGSRRSRLLAKRDISPENDCYMGSPTDENLLKRLDEHPEEFEKLIIESFHSGEEAVNYEAQLHSEYDVMNNPLFYNKANQTYNGFTTVTTEEMINRRKLDIDENGLNSYQRTIRKQIELRKLIIYEDGCNDLERAAIKGVETKRRTINDNGISLIEQGVIKHKSTRLKDVDDNGLNSYQRTALKISDSMRVVDDENLNAFQRGQRTKGIRFKRIGHKDFGLFRTADEFLSNTPVDVSLTLIRRLAVVGFDKKVSSKIYTTSSYIQSLGSKEDVVGLNWHIDLGFYVE